MTMTHTTTKPTLTRLVIAATLAIVSSLLTFPLKYDGEYFIEILAQNKIELFLLTSQTAWLYFLSAIASMQLYLHSHFFVGLRRRAIWIGGMVAVFIMLIFFYLPPFDTSSGVEEWVKTLILYNAVLNFLPYLVINSLACKLLPSAQLPKE